MSKIKKAACLLLATAIVWSGFGITSASISAYAGMGCLHTNGVRTEGVYLYTTTVETGFVSQSGNYYGYCTEVRNVNRLDKVCVDCGRKLGEKTGYRILSHSSPICTNVDVTE